MIPAFLFFPKRNADNQNAFQALFPEMKVYQESWGLKKPLKRIIQPLLPVGLLCCGKHKLKQIK